MSNIYPNIIAAFSSLAAPAKAAHLMRFFKTGPGQYGEGDKFLGLTVPQTRAIARQYFREISLADTEKLLHSVYHEHRLCALLIMRLKYEAARDNKDKEKIVKLYLKNTRYINNWDLVDLSAEYILGPWYFDNKETEAIYQLARSKNLWQERIAVIATFHHIRQRDYALTLELCEYFLPHKHDLMHKATGWMLREIGKRDLGPLFDFLDVHAVSMPRTMLRYSIEKLSPVEKQKYMKAGKK